MVAGGLREALRVGNILVLVGALALGGSLFLTWFAVGTGPDPTPVTGWFYLGPVDRALAGLSLTVALCCFAPKRRWVVVARAGLGVAALAVLSLYLLSLRGGADVLDLRLGVFVALAGACLIPLGGLLDLVPNPLDRLLAPTAVTVAAAAHRARARLGISAGAARAAWRALKAPSPRVRARREPEGPTTLPSILGSGARSPELDGIRGIAILMVMENHFTLLLTPLEWAGFTQLRPLFFLGWSGVDLFFVLSGFLLGGILLDNKGASNYFRVFYTRRVCRIFPLYFLVTIPLLVLALPSAGPLFSELLPPWTYLTFTQNFAMAAESSLGTVWLAPTWSLAAEEQFYLILPFLILVVSRAKLPFVLVGLMVASAAARVATLAFFPDPTSILLLPLRAEPLLMGVLGAWAVRNERHLALLRNHRMALYGVAGALALGVALIALANYNEETGGLRGFPLTYGFTLLSLLFIGALLIAVSERRGVVSSVTRNRALGKIGVISYGIYLFGAYVLEARYPDG